MTTKSEPTTPQEWNQAALELCGAKWYRHPVERSDNRVYRFLALPAIHEFSQSAEWMVKADGSESPCRMDYMLREFHLPDLHSVDACLKHIVPVMVSKRYWLDIDNCADPKIWVATFVRFGTNIGQDENPRGEEADLALAIVKAFVRAMKGSQ